MKPVLIVRTGRAPNPIRARHGDFPHWFRLGAGLHPRQLQVIDVAAGEALPAPREVAGAIITGSAAMVTERSTWSERTAGWIRDAMDIELPLFGVCYGHQLMAHALGGRVDYLPGGREIGTQTIEVSMLATRDPLAASLPARFRAHTTHEQSVVEPPDRATVLARSTRDPHQLLRYGPHALSVQFHPEFNAEVMRAYIRRKQADLRLEGADPEKIFSAVAATPIARQLLRRFSRHHHWAVAAG
ncbi:glutamine amidotransferase [Rhodanobacter denitrificans]|uniref:GMP synthase family protein n=1 Tax=Rhodanobacter denitrificans TaxID=666685 RepID=I4WJ31_9GAMM|nr:MULTISPECIES: glutamine amidotransferase [Rhodanobacter]AGG90893.1 GMP synthase family protein [Rhodanobacter denitrificans]EIL99472.1 glutamine amidotransferase [Rhodanobacter denitrificans]UJM86264.1 glutamine amidotransferase [Rhodanobacter denitrificans]UJM90682.1 glutamine amidotransferase [Rhodanobacter denitrificans]